MKRLIGVDTEGRLRFRNSKKNPIVHKTGMLFVNDQTSGIFDLHPDKTECIGYVESTNPKTGEIRIRLN